MSIYENIALRPMIPFNKPYLSGGEISHIAEALAAGKLSGDGIFTHRCQSFLERRYGFLKVLLTTSCTDALELAALLLDIKEGDEVIVPSFTFVSTANAFVLRGAKIVFVDSEATTPNLDVSAIESLITSKTRAIVPVHYAGAACEMDGLMALASKYNLAVVEDAAQAIDSTYKGRPLGSIGHLAAFSFHETKNIISGEGGMLAINDLKFLKRAEILREKGTNRSQFFRGEVDKYRWVDVGSSFLPSEIIAGFLWGQLENLEKIQSRRKDIWTAYEAGLRLLERKGKITIQKTPDYATNNSHMFYLLCNNAGERSALITHLRELGVGAVFHYLPLHCSPFYLNENQSEKLPNAERYSDCILRLPFYYELSHGEQSIVIEAVRSFFE